MDVVVRLLSTINIQHDEIKRLKEKLSITEP